MARMAENLALDVSSKVWVAKHEFSSLISECFEHALPGRNPYHGNGTGQPQGSSGQKGKDKSSRRVLDSTLQNDTIKTANRIQYELFPIGHQWGTFEPGPFVTEENKGKARKDLHALQELLFAAIQFSNFDLSIAEWLLELVVAGTACMIVVRGDDDNPLIFQTVSQSHVAFREGIFGKIDFISRKHRIRYSLIKQTWTDATLPELPKGAGQEEDPEVDILDLCYYDYQEKQWLYDVVIVSGLKGAEKKRIVEREYKINPWVIARWNKSAEEVQGRSLVMQALPDARVLSSVKSYLLRHAALAVGGAFLVKNDGTLNANTVRIFPGATIPVNSTGGANGTGASIAPLQVQGDMNLADLIIKDLVNAIHKTMMNDGMPDISEGVRTATELLERMKDLQQSLGSPFARILKEGIVPMLEAAISILAEIGLIPVDKDQKLKLNNGEIQIKFASPLVQGQSIREVEALQNAAAITKEIGGEEAVGLGFKVEDAGPWIGSKLGVVPVLMRDAEERKKMQQQAAQLKMAEQGDMPQVGGEGGVVPNTPQPQQQTAEALPLAA